MNRPTRAKLYERRREVANLALKGWTQAAIARQMRIPPATVSRDLAAIRLLKKGAPPRAGTSRHVNSSRASKCRSEPVPYFNRLLNDRA